MDDQQLMARLAQEDVSALEELIRRHRGAALRQARAFLRDDALAEDVVQEAFARVYLLRHRYRASFAFSTYLAAMVRNLCIDEWRRQKRGPVPQGETLAASAEMVFLEQERRMALWRMLGSLADKDRALLTGYALDGLSYQQLAQREGITTAMVRVRLHRIRRKLRKERDGE